MENSERNFTITYRFQFCGLRMAGYDEKNETSFYSDGRVTAKKWKKDIFTDHYKIADRKEGNISVEEVREFYDQCMRIVQDHEIAGGLSDAKADVLIETPGMNITIDATLGNEGGCFMSIAEKMIEKAGVVLDEEE